MALNPPLSRRTMSIISSPKKCAGVTIGTGTGTIAIGDGIAGIGVTGAGIGGIAITGEPSAI
jgi:hypothetical protein